MDTSSIRQECILERDSTLDLLYGGSKFSLERDWCSEIRITTANTFFSLSFSLVVFIKRLFINAMSEYRPDKASLHLHRNSC